MRLATTTLPIVPTIKLQIFKFEQISGDIQAWPRSWEQFQSFLETNPSVSQTNKHVFLRGYFEGEPKHSVDGIAVMQRLMKKLNVFYTPNMATKIA